MGLDHGYGVLIGVKNGYYRDPVNNYGQYFHGNLLVGTPGGVYHCAIDVDSKSVPNGVQWRVIELRASMLKGLDLLADGWHPLGSDPGSGALDYLRNPELNRRRLCLVPGPLRGRIPGLRRFLPRWLTRLCFYWGTQPWKSGVSLDALAELEPLLAAAQRIWVFGEPFSGGDRGVHNVHQNQGDPLASPWAAENGIWQDGATLIQRTDGSYAVFCNKFTTQAEHTDAQGHPA